MTISPEDAPVIVSTIQQIVDNMANTLRTEMFQALEAQREEFYTSLVQVGANQQMIYGVMESLRPILSQSGPAAPGFDGGTPGGVHPSPGTTEAQGAVQAALSAAMQGNTDQTTETSTLLRKKGE